MFSICTSFHDNISKVLELFSGHDFTLKFTKGHNSVNNVSEVMVLVFCTSSDDVLYLYQVS